MSKNNGSSETVWEQRAPDSWRTLGVARGDREARRERRRLERHQEDQVRLLDGWEQYRALWDGIDFKRQLINMGDKKVRFALVIMGVLNAILLIVLTRGPVLRALPPGTRLWLVILLVIYGIVSFGFVVHAIEALRPKPEARRPDNSQWQLREAGPSEREAAGGPVGLFIHGPEIVRTFDEDRRAWSRARLSEVNAELILFNRTSSLVLTGQLHSLGKVYQGLKILAILAAMVLALLVGSTLFADGAIS